MNVIDIAEYNEEVVLHFGGEKHKLNAYTLASSLVSVADAVKEANSIINPGYNVEVIVEAFSAGSFRALIKTAYTGAENLFSKENLKAITLSVIASFVYEHTFSADEKVSITVNTEEVIIEQGDTKVVVPRQTYEATKEVRKSEKFKKSISRIANTIEKDTSVTSFGFTKTLSDKKADIDIPKKGIILLSNPDEIAEPTREVEESATLFIKRAILERSKRKWEFVWSGFKISAPVLDQQFYDDFFAHKVKIAPGDQLEVQLKIYQSKDEDSGIYSNDRYEITKVVNHLPNLTQSEIVV